MIFFTVRIFNQDNAASDDWRIMRINLYAMLPIWTPIKGDTKNLILGKLQKVFQVMNVARPDGWDGVILGVLRLLLHADDFSSDQGETDTTTAGWQCEYPTDEELDAVAYKRVKFLVMLMRKEENAHRNLYEDSLRALSKIIEIFQSHNIRVILFTPPYYKAFNESFEDQAPEMIIGMHRALRLLQDKYGISYFNFSDNPEMTTENEFFNDSDHLNACGCKAFSERLLKAISESHNTLNAESI